MEVEAYLKKKFRPKFALGSNNYSHFTLFLSHSHPKKIRGVSVGLLFKKTKKMAHKWSRFNLLFISPKYGFFPA